ncbi:lysylphosphatidylglycerol synthase transmembrane domain-containing protein [Zeaxanthinibacter sp. PT1]|uniref:lysylphosphatidylglycerol synthase transmembrane domain-containing protein n=1 Tax=Zeaxanthinibacter TaxID=561554 RepID=UPI00234B0E09|nr:lysylphosphatidylglycerol synthase transmembrane domain-containing protein [Zeaxanthinibacter sp. PT1]MDC6352558.1 lysylphosphatidylglycerol synthase transmembrane domain-containing protein [Zeaxanthinibacter sp. PT1]
MSRKKITTALKIIFSLLLLYFIFTKIEPAKVWQVLKRSEPLYVLAALLFFIVSKILSAFRLNLYFHQLQVFLTQLSNLKLYLLGMFYNLFLPGGIGGDAYKGYLVRKKFDVRTKEVVAALVVDRLSGMLLLFIYACILAISSLPDYVPGFSLYLGTGMVLSVLVFWGLQKRYFPYLLPVFWSSFAFSAMVQFSQLIAAYFILKALAVDYAQVTYLLIFLISSIVAVLPLTLGGIGSREVVFYYGALWFGLEEQTSVGISMMFFLITALVSLGGFIYHFRKPELEVILNRVQKN